MRMIIQEELGKQKLEPIIKSPSKRQQYSYASVEKAKRMPNTNQKIFSGK